MTKFYYDPESKGFYQTDFHKIIPKTAVEITDKFRWELINGQSTGKEISFEQGVISLEDKEFKLTEIFSLERDWRDAQLTYADIELNKVQDSDPKAIGSVSDWRAYRKALRAWPEHKDFPNKDKRPVSPDV